MVGHNGFYSAIIAFFLFLYDVSNGKAWLSNKLGLHDAMWVASIHYVECALVHKRIPRTFLSIVVWGCPNIFCNEFT